MAGKKPFLLGVGCHKGGTSWLWDYLNSHPECAMPPSKEMHIFDSFFLPEKFGHFHVRRFERIKQLLGTNNDPSALTPQHPLFQAMQFVLMRQDLQQYPLYLDRLNQPGKNTPLLVGDITPSYCALREPHFAKIRQLMTNFNYETKVVFLMRDPIDRIFSALRMFDRDKSHRGKAPATERFDSEYADWRRRVRTDYQATIEALEAVFPIDKIFYGFYETLFSEAEVKRLTDFLGINYKPADFEKRVNASPNKSRLSEKQITMARKTYDWVYKFSAEKFGADFIRSIWKHY